MPQDRDIRKINEAKEEFEGVGFRVRKPIGNSPIDPFIMMDHVDPDRFEPEEAFGAPDHPHKGFVTLTYVIEGEVEHKDSLGNTAILKSGDAQLITAGSGIVHSEMPSDNFYKRGGKMEGFQLWINVPSFKRLAPPSYNLAKDIEMHQLSEKVQLRIIVGSLLNFKGPMECGDVTVVDIRMKAFSDARLPVPEGFCAFLYVWRGDGLVTAAKKEINLYDSIFFEEKGESIVLKTGGSEMNIIVGMGKPIGEPFLKRGPFVMSNQQEINKAYEEYRQGKLGTIPGKESRLEQVEKAVEKHKARLALK